jgi:hypothetical protein
MASLISGLSGWACARSAHRPLVAAIDLAITCVGGGLVMVTLLLLAS